MNDNYTRMERTNILPLRWLANFLEMPAHYLLTRAVNRYHDTLNPGDVKGWDIRLSNFLYNKVVLRWGTFYALDWEDDADTGH